MAQHSRVPKFGNWENDQDVPYTQYFDKARKGKNAGKMINPNDPQDNMDVNTDDKRSIQAPPFRNGGESDARVGEGALKPKHERRFSKEDSDLKRLTDSPARHETAGRRTTSEHHRNTSSGETPKRAGRPDRSIEHSPLHPHQQARTGGRGTGVSSPAWERRSSEGSHGVAPNTPGRSRMRPVARGDETPDKGGAVPKFGEWDENNPASADGFTHIFNKMREEKQGGSTNATSVQDDMSYSNGYKQDDSNKSTECCCFAWFKK
ncbi:Rpm1-interacting protein [Thalictrum thalictroides]|uniref:Rpm1-interacting protein n=1 Tax=Thalictrum thalictroides TaxID=46969 RepID=A0A7J6W9U9_THATH|nr:Rpm1-interacting protein [Thalictrum thalictroides]